MAYIREDLLPNSPKSTKLIKMIREHIDLSYKTVATNYPIWDTVERQFRAYRPSDDDDRESRKKHGVQKIIIPIQFATIQTMLTFMMEVFTALKPVLRVRGADPESVKRARIMEIALDYDYRNNRGYFTLQQWFLNGFRYGYGIVENTWGQKQILKKVITPGPDIQMNLAGQTYNVPGPLTYEDSWFTLFEGNQWRIVDNRSFFYDPRVGISNFQDGSFCGHRAQVHENTLFKLEEQGILFNTTRIDKGSATLGSTRDSELGVTDHERDHLNPTLGFTEELLAAKRARMLVNEQIIIELIPKEYELSEEDRPQPWIFNVINGHTIVRAERSPFNYFPYAIVEPNPDALAVASQGIIQLTQPLSEHLDFLFNSHMQNVRKAINDMLLVDPSRIDLRDLLNPSAGKVIRLLPLAYGTDPAAAIKQLAVADVTRGHMEDAKMIMELWERVTGATDSMFGQISPGRRTALELQGVFRQAGARMKMMADLFSAEGVAPLTEQMALLRQENMSMAQFMEIAGHSAASLGVSPDEIVEGMLAVTRDHLTGVFSYPAEEGVLPQDRAAAAEILKGVFDTIARAPFLAQVFDPIAIFREMIRQSGYHGLDEFMNRGVVPMQTQMFAPELINEYLASKKIQPMMLGGNAGGRPDEGVRESREGLSIEGAINGAGRPQDY